VDTESVGARRLFRLTPFRIRVCVVGFVVLYAVLALRLVDVTVLHPRMPSPAQIAGVTPNLQLTPPPPDRATIEDRDGRILAVSLPSAALYADPKQVQHPRSAAARLETALPMLDEARVARLLAFKQSGFVYLDRNLTSLQEIAVNRLGIPGLYFLPTWKRHYPQGDLAAHIIGGVTAGQTGISGLEAYFNHRLEAEPLKPLRLSIDLPVQAIVHEELAQAVRDWKAKAACGIVEDMTGHIVAMVSLPSYNANDMHTAPADALLDRCVSGDYEPGSVEKLMTMSMGLQSGLINVWDKFNTTHPLCVYGFCITDYEPAKSWLTLPQILDVSSNIGASRIATILGPEIERAWFRKIGYFAAPPIQIPGAEPGLWHSKADWHLLTTMTVSFGNGIAVTPVVLTNAVVAAVNGGVLFQPTLLAPAPGAPPRRGIRIMRPSVSYTIRKMMRDVVVDGTGVYARVPGYLVGGKTGTSQVVAADHRYDNHLNDSSFMSIFPANNPRYVVFVLVIQPRPTKKMDKFSYGFTTGGYVSAPVVSRIISRIGPLLGVTPARGAALARANAELALPLVPKPPPGAIALGPKDPFPPGADRYAYILAGETPPAHPDRAAQLAALQRVKMAVPDVTLPSNNAEPINVADNQFRESAQLSG
jgi:cell division protein FtsI (penicillin-binding protein 3)